ncbi:MAG: hypothetical protein JWP59_4679 [Massilia sp.]|jgi:uncharacterized protein (TIGR02001 family)|nr:hypothetical protein [Massilia sp.]
MFPVHCHKKHALSLVLLFGVAATAPCQTSADLTITSEYAARGMALDSRPALQLRVEHDSDAGWYGGAFASPVALSNRRQGQLTAYAGRARQLTSTLSWDAGVTRSVYLRDSHLNYHEIYAGLTHQRISARLFYSPAYYGDERSLYLDLNGAYPLNDQLSVALHGGWLHLFGESGRNLDVRLALAYDMGDYSLKAGWQLKGHGYLHGSSRARALSVSASRRF